MTFYIEKFSSLEYSCFVFFFCSYLNKKLISSVTSNWNKFFSFHKGLQGGYQNTGSYQNYPQEQYIRPQTNTLPQQGEFSQPYSSRSHYPPYMPDVDR